MEALAAASYFPDITLPIGLTASDFIWQGFEQGRKDGCKEWPGLARPPFPTAGSHSPIFRSAKEHPDECEATRKDVDRRLSTALHEWIAA